MRVHKLFSSFLSLLLLVAGYQSVSAQSGVDSLGNGGMHTIQGRIYLPNGRTSDASLPVRLESLNHPPVKIFADRNGGFSFKLLSPGNYSIVVDAGDNFMVATEYFTIEPEVQGPVVRIRPIPKVFSVPIYLQFKSSVITRSGVINAKFAAVPKDALEHCQEGIEYARAGKNEEAVKAFRKAIGIYPQFAVPYTEIGKIYLKSGKIDLAVDELSKAAAIDPSDFQTKLNYGIALMGKRVAADAETQLRAAAELDRTAVTPHYYLGLLFVQNKRLDDAQKEMEAARLLKGEKDFPLVHKYLAGIYWEKKQYRAAADELEKYVQLDPTAKGIEQMRKTIVDLRSRQN